jgi:hypothetical protein
LPHGDDASRSGKTGASFLLNPTTDSLNQKSTAKDVINCLYPFERFYNKMGNGYMGFLTDRYTKKLSGVLSCFDRVLTQGTFPGFYFTNGMSLFLSRNTILLYF